MTTLVHWYLMSMSKQYEQTVGILGAGAAHGGHVAHGAHTLRRVASKAHFSDVKRRLVHLFCLFVLAESGKHRSEVGAGTGDLIETLRKMGTNCGEMCVRSSGSTSGH
jgi:hypothetical protein